MPGLPGADRQVAEASRRYGNRQKKVTLGVRVRFPFVSVSFSYAADESRDIAETFQFLCPSICVHLSVSSCVSVSSFCVYIKAFIEPTSAVCKGQIISIDGKPFFAYFHVLHKNQGNTMARYIPSN